MIYFITRSLCCWPSMLPCLYLLLCKANIYYASESGKWFSELHVSRVPSSGNSHTKTSVPTKWSSFRPWLCRCDPQMPFTFPMKISTNHSMGLKPLQSTQVHAKAFLPCKWTCENSLPRTLYSIPEELSPFEAQFECAAHPTDLLLTLPHLPPTSWLQSTICDTIWQRLRSDR